MFFENKKPLEVVILTKEEIKEPFWKSRRIWGAILTAITAIYVIIMPEHYDLAVMLGAGVASALGITSFIKPKK